MKVEAVDVFYLRMPLLEDIDAGGQGALAARARGGHKGWADDAPALLPPGSEIITAGAAHVVHLGVPHTPARIAWAFFDVPSNQSART